MPAARRAPHWALAVAGCAVACVAACVGILGRQQRAVLAAARCGPAGCAAVQQDVERTRAGQRRVRRGRTADPGLLGRADANVANTFGSLAAVGKIGQAKTPSLVSFNAGHAFEGGGIGPKWENTRTAVFGHHAGDPKVMESAADTEARQRASQHEAFYYDQAHDDNGRGLNGENPNAPAWWPKGRQHQPRPLVTWGSRFAGEPWEEEHKDDSALVRAGVNVEGQRDVFRGLPLPWYDQTQWDHDRQQAVDAPRSPYEFKMRDEQSSASLTKAGVAVSRDPFVTEREQGQQDKVVVRAPCTYRYVDGVAGMQTHSPYFTDPNGLKSLKASKYKLEKAGVLLSSNLFDRAMPAPHLASYDPTRADGCDQGDSDHIVDFGKTHRLPEGQLDVEMEPPHGTTHYVDVFSPDYHGPGAKHLTTQGDPQFH